MLKREHAAEAITVTLDLGQGRELEAVRDRALAAGAARAHVLDARDEFAREYALRALKAGALRDGHHPMGAELARLIVAQKAVEIARIEGAGAVAHCVRLAQPAGAFERAVRALEPAMEVVAIPVRVDAGPRDERTPKTASPYPDEPAYVDVNFNRGVPAAINGVEMPLVDLIGSLGTIAAAHGVGGRDNLAGTIAFEAPAAVVLHAAHRALQTRLLDHDVEPFAAMVRTEYARIIAEGRWFSPLREALDAFVNRVQEQVTGAVRVKLFRGTLAIGD